MRRRLGILNKDKKNSRDLEPRRYLAGLSFGPSSTVMAAILDTSADYHANKKASSPFEPHVVHIDTTESPDGQVSEQAAKKMDEFRAKFPHITFECVHVSRAMGLSSINWTLLPVPQDESLSPQQKLSGMFNALPSTTSRADVLRMLIRHLLISVALENNYSTLLLAHSTTALAALTLAEVANGRGFSVPAQVNDGSMTVCTYEGGKETSRLEFPVHYPLREVLKNELLKYMDLVPALQDMKIDEKQGAVVSHKDVSIEEVMQRYFEGVEGPYAGIVTNVVRTTGKLEPISGSEFCGLCGLTLDEKGDSRWAGELGDEDHHGEKLCYGCKRSVHG